MKQLHRGIKFIIVIAAIVLAAMFGTAAYAAGYTAQDDQSIMFVGAEVTAVRIHTLPDRTKYNIGEELDLTGCKLAAALKSRDVLVIDVTENMVSGFDSSAAGICTLTVTYCDKSASFDVKITELPIAATPVFDPANGTVFSADMEISLTCATENAEIYYTTDGTAPTAQSTRYEGAFTLDKPATVQAVAVADGFEDSEIAVAKYTAKTDSNDDTNNGGGGGNGGSYEPYITPPPSINGEPSTWEKIALAIAKLPHGSAITIQLNGNYTVPAYVIAAIAEVDARVTFVIDDMRSWYLDGALVDEPCDANLGATRIASIRTGRLLGNEGIQLRTYGADVPAILTVDFGDENADIYANIYRKTDGRLEFAGICKTDALGRAALPELSGKGDYVVMLFDYSSLEGDVNNDGVMNALDAAAILRDIALIEPSGNPVMRDHDGNGAITEADAHAILIDIVYGRYIA